MKIDIVPVTESEILPESSKTSSIQKLESAQIELTYTSDLEQIFAKFLQMEVGDGAASADTIRNYLSQTKQYLNWCRDILLSPTEAEPEDIKLYRQHLVNSGYAPSTIATKLNIIRIFYNAALSHGAILSNPALKIKAPREKKDPAARITWRCSNEGYSWRKNPSVK